MKCEDCPNAEWDSVDGHWFIYGCMGECEEDEAEETMADEYVRKEDVADTIPKERIVEYMDEFGAGYNSCRNDTLRSIESLTPADVAPVVHAHWIPQKENHEFKEAWMKCSACGYPVSRWTGNTKFCPNCGAKMDAKEKG